MEDGVASVGVVTEVASQAVGYEGTGISLVVPPNHVWIVPQHDPEDVDPIAALGLLPPSPVENPEPSEPLSESASNIETEARDETASQPATEDSAPSQTEVDQKAPATTEEGDAAPSGEEEPNAPEAAASGDAEPRVEETQQPQESEFIIKRREHLRELGMGPFPPVFMYLTTPKGIEINPVPPTHPDRPGWRYYLITISSVFDTLEVELRADKIQETVFDTTLFLRHEDIPSEDAYDLSVNLQPNTSACTLTLNTASTPALQSGTYYIAFTDLRLDHPTMVSISSTELAPAEKMKMREAEERARVEEEKRLQLQREAEEESLRQEMARLEDERLAEEARLADEAAKERARRRKRRMSKSGASGSRRSSIVGLNSSGMSGSRRSVGSSNRPTSSRRSVRSLSSTTPSTPVQEVQEAKEEEAADDGGIRRLQAQ